MSALLANKTAAIKTGHQYLHPGELFGVPGAGVRQVFSATFILQFADGKVINTRRNAADLQRLFQLEDDGTAIPGLSGPHRALFGWVFRNVVDCCAARRYSGTMLAIRAARLFDGDEFRDGGVPFWSTRTGLPGWSQGFPMLGNDGQFLSTATRPCCLG